MPAAAGARHRPKIVPLRQAMLSPIWARGHIGRILIILASFMDECTMSNRRLNWRILLAVFIAATLALAPAIAEARAGSSAGGRSSSMGSRGSRTFEDNGAQPLSRSVTPLPQPSRPPAFAPAPPAPALGGGSFFQRQPFC